MTDDDAARRADRIEGVLLGSACGDALGVPYEFGSAPLGPSEAPRMIGGGLGPYAPGEWSDDTQMAAVVAQVAADRGLRDDDALDAVVDGWVGWLRDGASDVGNQTSYVLGEVAAEPGAPRPAERARQTAQRLHERTGHTAGNGSLMRTAPVALAFLGDPATLTLRARAISDLTHADPLAGDACVLWCHAIRRAVLDATMPDLGALVAELPADRRDQWVGWIAEAERPPAVRLLAQRLRRHRPAGGLVGRPAPARRRLAGGRVAGGRGARGQRHRHGRGHRGRPPRCRPRSVRPSAGVARPTCTAGRASGRPTSVTSRAASPASLGSQPRRTAVTFPPRDSSTVISTRCLPGFFAQ